MNAKLTYTKNRNDHSEVVITGSKSESNRLLILQALFDNLSLENLSDSDDTKVLQKALAQVEGAVDIHHAGTAMRFLTAYFASTPGIEVILTGSIRMRERPIAILVDALRELGAQIGYLEEEGFPPLKISGKKLVKNKVSVNAHVSSQYISALLLVAPSLSQGLQLTLMGELTSVPYIKMTLSLLNALGVKSSFKGNTIEVVPCEKITPKTIVVESDWSSASYFYSYVALAENVSVTLKSYVASSLQGDAALVKLYESFGVQTLFNADNKSITLVKSGSISSEEIRLDLNKTPDLAQTIAVTCFGLRISCNLKGLHTLKIKETDRLLALKIELEKLGASVVITDATLRMTPGVRMRRNAIIETYQDHRMAMAFAPLACLIPLEIEHVEVVSKSYPSFFSDFEKLGIIGVSK